MGKQITIATVIGVGLTLASGLSPVEAAKSSLSRKPASSSPASHERFESPVADLHGFFLEGAPSHIQLKVSKSNALSVSGNLSLGVVRFRFPKDQFRGEEHVIEFESTWMADAEVSRKKSAVLQSLSKQWSRFRWSSLINSSRRPDTQGMVPVNLVVLVLFESSLLPGKWSHWCSKSGESFTLEARVKILPNPNQNLSPADPVRSDDARYRLTVTCE